MTRRFFLVLFSWSGFACLLLFAIDGIPDTEQFDGILVATSLPLAGNNLPLDSPISDSVAASISALSIYLAFLLRSPPSLVHFASTHFNLRDPSALGRLPTTFKTGDSHLIAANHVHKRRCQCAEPSVGAGGTVAKPGGAGCLPDGRACEDWPSRGRTACWLCTLRV